MCTMWFAHERVQGLVINMKTGARIHVVLFVLEVAALIHDLHAFGLSMFTHYTIDSNVAQMIVSGIIIYMILIKGKELIPVWLSTLHLICAVCLTITFLISLFVLAPQEGFAYYFLENVAPINHLIGPLLSVITFLFFEHSEPLPPGTIFMPMLATLLYGVVALLLNVIKVLDGPYFFLRVYEVPAGTIVMWFVIIALLCIILSAVYWWGRRLRSGT